MTNQQTDLEARFADGVASDLVQRLVRGQFPEWGDLPLLAVDSAGVDNSMFRLGTDFSVRLPRSPWAARHILKERLWLPRLAPHLNVGVPLSRGHGRPTAEFPWNWSVNEWLPGEDALSGPVEDELQLAEDLASFLRSLRSRPVSSAPRSGLHSGLRGVPLPVRDQVVRAAARSVEDVIDVGPLLDLWNQLTAVPPWTAAPQWVHGDLHPGNLVVSGGKLSGVIDWGLMSVGDPALDVSAAWMVLAPGARPLFRALLEVDDDTWFRGRGWALCIGVIAFGYYRYKNEVLAGFSRRGLIRALNSE